MADNKETQIFIRVSETEKAELTELLARHPNPDMTQSQFAREAIREKMVRLRRSLDRQAATTATA